MSTLLMFPLEVDEFVVLPFMLGLSLSFANA